MDICCESHRSLVVTSNTRWLPLVIVGLWVGGPNVTCQILKMLLLHVSVAIKCPSQFHVVSFRPHPKQHFQMGPSWA